MHKEKESEKSIQKYIMLPLLLMLAVCVMQIAVNFLTAVHSHAPQSAGFSWYSSLLSAAQNIGIMLSILIVRFAFERGRKAQMAASEVAATEQ